VLLDIRLPDGSGFDFCRQLRQKGFHLPVIMLTARNEELDKVLGLEMGADDYVTKPFSLRELVSRIRASCGGRTAIMPWRDRRGSPWEICYWIRPRARPGAARQPSP